MPAKSLLLQGRLAAERLMTDTCLHRRPSDQVVTDPETGQTSHGYDTINADLRCKIQGNSPASATPESGHHRYIIEQLRLHLPIGTESRAGDEFEILTSETDPDNIGLVFVINELDRGTYRVSQRWSVEVKTR